MKRMPRTFDTETIHFDSFSLNQTVSFCSRTGEPGYNKRLADSFLRRQSDLVHIRGLSPLLHLASEILGGPPRVGGRMKIGNDHLGKLCFEIARITFAFLGGEP